MRKLATLLTIVLMLASVRTRGCGGSTPTAQSHPDPNTLTLDEEQTVINLDPPYDEHVSAYQTQMYGEVVTHPSTATGTYSSWSGTPASTPYTYAQATLTNMVLPATYRFEVSAPAAYCYNQWGPTKSLVGGGTYIYDCYIYVHTTQFDSTQTVGYSYDWTGDEIVDPNLVGDTLNDSQQFLFPADGLQSGNGDWTVVYLTNGNLVKYNSSSFCVWQSATDGSGGGNAHTHLQDGNLVIYDSGTNPVWTTNTGGHSGAYMVMQDDGNLVIYDSGGTPLWSTGIQ